MKRSAGTAVSVLLVVGIGVAGCGGPSTPPPAFARAKPSQAGSASPTPMLSNEEKKPASAVLADMRAAFLGSSSVRVHGNQYDEDELADITGQLGPTSGQLDEQTTNGVVSFVSANGENYIKAPAAYLQAQDTTVPGQLADRWFAVPAGDPSATVTLRGFLDGLDLPPASQLKPAVTTDVVGGRAAVVLTYTDGQVLYVADDGKPVLLGHSNGVETQTFDDYDQPLQVTAPSDAVHLGGSGRHA